MGVEDLDSQTGKTWSSDVNRLDPDEPDELTHELTDDSLDEGFAESEEVDLLQISSPQVQPLVFYTTEINANLWLFELQDNLSLELFVLVRAFSILLWFFFPAQSSSQEDSSTRNEEPPTTDVHVLSDSDDTSDTELQVRIHVVSVRNYF